MDRDQMSLSLVPSLGIQIQKINKYRFLEPALGADIFWFIEVFWGNIR